MKDISVLIKPSSGMCNLACKYCFYNDEAKNRSIENYGFMSERTLENVIKKSLDYATNSCTICYQGGEPTLRGLEFFKKSVEFQKKYNSKDIQVNNAIQTNGIGLDEEFIRFLKDNNFLVGISLDGNKDTHDIFRVSKGDKGTFKDVMNTIQKFKEYSIQYNVLTVVHSQTTRRIQSIYDFYIKNGFEYLQFIPCLNPIGEEGSRYPYSLSVKAYTKFLKTLFDLWYLDVKKGHYIHVQQFENYILMLQGHPPVSCGMGGVCSYQYVIEADGEAYPCDFYVLDEYKLGNLNQVTYKEVDEVRKDINFIDISVPLHKECLRCRFKNICRGGCRRLREPFGSDGLSKNYYCEAYYDFFDYAIDRLEELAASNIFYR